MKGRKNRRGSYVINATTGTTTTAGYGLTALFVCWQTRIVKQSEFVTCRLPPWAEAERQYGAGRLKRSFSASGFLRIWADLTSQQVCLTVSCSVRPTVFRMLFFESLSFWTVCTSGNTLWRSTEHFCSPCDPSECFGDTCWRGGRNRPSLHRSQLWRPSWQNHLRLNS